MIWLCYLLLLAIALTGIVLVLLTLPGLWLTLAAAAGYAALTHHLARNALIALFLLALTAEILEFTLGGAAAKKAGGGCRAAIGAILGGIAGGIFLTVIPIFILSTIVGVCLGSFLGAAAFELLGGQPTAHSLRVGFGAAQGRFIGLAAKFAFGIVMFLVVLVCAWP